MKEKIEEILGRYTNSPVAFDDGVERVTFQERYFPISDLVKELSTLIQEERKDAVKKFAGFLSDHDKSEGSVYWYDEMVEEYLKESEGKKWVTEYITLKWLYTTKKALL